MEFDRTYFAGKTTAVTGGASGIGLALCEELLESGAAKVVLVDVNSDTLAQEEGRLNSQYPGKVKGVLCNVTQEDAVKRMVEEACDFGGGRLDLLINCAGSSLIGTFFRMPVTTNSSPNPHAPKVATNEDWKKGFALNFFASVYSSRYALPIMLKQGGGQIVNIISGIAFAPMANQSMYGATKSALQILTYSLRGEYAPYNIKFNAATPGTTVTPMTIGAGLSPAEGQTPHQAAQRILNGVVSNDRLILGDDADVDGAENCYLPDAYAQRFDKILLTFARERRSGKASFQITEDSSDLTEANAVQALFNNADHLDADAATKRNHEYFAKREADKIPEGYYNGKTAVVTGGASGIGLGLCEKLLECGAKKVVLADFIQDNLDTHTERLNGVYSGKVKGILCNVADEESVQAMITSAAAFFDGPFDILINCAGIGQMGMFAENPNSDVLSEHLHMQIEPQEHWEKVFSVNFYGPLYGCRAVLPIMIKQGSGQIVNIISGTGIIGMPFQTIYASSKAALNGLSLALRYEFWDDGIKINSSTPGTVATAIFDGVDLPASAQTPEHAAMRILTGAARNERVIFGDDNDIGGAIVANKPSRSGYWDEYYAKLVASRVAGKMDY